MDSQADLDQRRTLYHRRAEGIWAENPWCGGENQHHRTKGVQWIGHRCDGVRGADTSGCIHRGTHRLLGEFRRYFFEKQLELAEKYNLPVIVHARESIQDTYDILKKYKVKGSMHCYAGSLEMAKEFIKLGFKIGVDGPITYENNKKGIELVKEIDLKDLLLETDSPYLSPVPNRGKQNSPLNLEFIASKIADIKGIDIKEVEEVTTKTAKELYRLWIKN